MQTFPIKALMLDFSSFAGDGPAILKSITPDHPYGDDRKQIKEKIVGRKVSVVLPGNGYEVLEVKVSDPTDALTPLLEKAHPGEPVYVEFVGFTAKTYNTKDGDIWKTGISAKATAVRAVPGPEAIDY